LAIENVSDADFIYLSEIDFDSADFDLEHAAKVHFPFVNGLELSRLNRAQLNKIQRPQRRPYFHMLLKTQCLFLAGEDITKSIAPFKIGPEMVSHAFSLAGEFASLPGLLEESRKTGHERDAIQWFSRRIVRAGFEITMNRSDRFTRDLYLCHEQFAAFYPERSQQMYQVLLNCLNGHENPLQYQELVTFLAKKGLQLLL
jgi:hypothetical protein